MKSVKVLAFVAILFISGLGTYGYLLSKQIRNASPTETSVSNSAPDQNDALLIQTVKVVIKWVEDFYTAQGRYPNQNEFSREFPGSESYSYTTYSEMPGSFLLQYQTAHTSPAAIGTAQSGFYGFSGYVVAPCPRWAEAGLSNEPIAAVYEFFPNTKIDGVIVSDFEAGIVSFVYSDRVGQPFANSKVKLLKGLIKPRLFNSKNPNELYITNGDTIYLYTVQPVDKTYVELTNPKKFAPVPTGCPSNYFK